jgi:hypothetical protein
MIIDKACAERGCPMHEEGDEYVEMVTVLSKGKLLPSETWFTIQCKDNELYIDGVCQAVNKLYLKVPKNEWVGLTDEEYDELMLSGDWGGSLIQATQAKLKEKNQE